MCYKIGLYGNKPYFIVTFESLQASALVTWLVKMADIDLFKIVHKLFAMATDRLMSARISDRSCWIFFWPIIR